MFEHFENRQNKIKPSFRQICLPCEKLLLETAVPQKVIRSIQCSEHECLCHMAISSATPNSVSLIFKQSTAAFQGCFRCILFIQIWRQPSNPRSTLQTLGLLLTNQGIFIIRTGYLVFIVALLMYPQLKTRLNRE